MEFDIRTGELSAAELEDNFDFDYSVGEVFIYSMETFRRELLEPFRDKDRHIFYRGERVGGLNRPLLPTMYRNKSTLMRDGGHCVEVNADFLLDYYKSYGSFSTCTTPPSARLGSTACTTCAPFLSTISTTRR